MKQILVALALLIATPACQREPGDLDLSADMLPKLALSRSLSVHEFRSVSTFAGQEVVVEGLAEDDYRYSALVSVNGRPAYEEVVADDRRYLRVIDPAVLFPADMVTRLRANRVVVPVLSGSWVADPFGAPEEFTAGRELEQVPLAPQLVLRAVRLLEQLPETLKEGLREYNKLAIYYLPKDDKFPEHKDDGKRFDKVPAAYDTTASTVTLDELRRYFEYVSVWSQPDGLTRVERLLELPDPSDDRYTEIYGQLKRAGSSRLQALVGEGEDGRRVTETYFTGPAGAAAAVQEPANAAKVNLAAVLNILRATVTAAQPPSPLYGPIT